MPFAQLNDVEIYYELEGIGPDVLVISGTGSDLRIPRLPNRDFDDSYHIVRYDHRGLGQSSSSERPVTMEQFAHDAASLLDFLSIVSVDVIGISFGGMVAQHLAIQYPHKVKKLVLACTSAGGEGNSSADLLSLMQLSKSNRQQKWLNMYDRRYGNVDNENLFVHTLDRLLQQEPGLFPNKVMPGLLHQLKARSEHDVSKSLEKITHPCLVVGGEFDAIAPPDNLTYLSEHIPLADLHFFKGGHSFLWEDPMAWVTISTFLKKDGLLFEYAQK
ncbi:MAG: alpha/beta hydrolase [Acidimicrobiales bacterium]|nr:alpha/beta hydrolase [Acidimicrobiales bacterium]